MAFARPAKSTGERGMFKIEATTLKSALRDKLLDQLRKYLDDTADDWNYITPEELHKQLKKGTKKYFLLDIRKPDTFKDGHIKGAKNIFWLDLLDEKNLDKLPKDKTIVVICYVGHTASQILVLLKLLGYKAVGLKFGMGVSPVEGVPVAGWRDFGYDEVNKIK